MEQKSLTRKLLYFFVIISMALQSSAVMPTAQHGLTKGTSGLQNNNTVVLITEFTASDIPIGQNWTSIDLVNQSPTEAGLVSRVLFKYSIESEQNSRIEIRIHNRENGKALSLPVQEISSAKADNNVGEISAFSGAPAQGPWWLEARTIDTPAVILTSATIQVEQPTDVKPLTVTSGDPGKPTMIRLSEKPAGVSAGNDPNAQPKPVTPRDLRGDTTIMSQNFEGAFPDTGWNVFDNLADGYEYLWDDESNRPFSGSWAGWPAGAGANALLPSQGYANNMSSWMVYGPFDLSGAATAKSHFYRWGITEQDLDYLYFGVSTDGTNFNGLSWSGDTAGWVEQTVNFDEYVGNSSVYVGWYFHSDSSITYEGAWVDDITVSKTLPVACGPYASKMSSLPIPENSIGLSRQIVPAASAPLGGVLDEVHVKYGLTHPNPAEIEVNLTHDQSGKTVSLTGGATIKGDQLKADLTLTEFSSLDPSTWTLNVLDKVPGNQGTLDYFTVQPTYKLTSPPTIQVTGGLPGTPVAFQIPPGAAVTVNPTNEVSPPKGTLPGGDARQALGWNTILSEGFEGAFPSGAWSVNDNSADGCDFQWDDDSYRHSAGSWAAWPANGGANGLNPATSKYPPNMNSWMVYGPFDLSDATDARIAFKLWLQTEQNFDNLFFGISSDGVNYNGYSYTGSMDWTTESISFPTYTGDSSVWIAFRFLSDSSINMEGAWVDEITLEKYTGFVVGDCTNGYSKTANLSQQELLEAYQKAIDLVPKVQQNASDPNEIRMESRQFIPTPGVDSATLNQLRAKAVGDKPVHLLLQFYQPPTPEQKAGLKARGINLLDYIPSNTWIASVEPNAIATLPMESGIRWAGVLTPADRTSNFLSNATLLTFYANPDNRLPLIVEFADDLSLSDGRTIIEQHAGSMEGQVQSINALMVYLPKDQLNSLAAEDGVIWIELPLQRMEGLNDCVRRRIGVDSLQGSSYGLNGSGVDLLVYDAGTVATTHSAFTGRLTVGDSSGTMDHSTHVAGTAAGDGTGSPLLRDLKGMAPAARVISYGFQTTGGDWLYTDPGDIESDWRTAKNTYGADLGTASIGTNTAANGFPCEWEGNYGAVSQLIDSIVRGSLGEPYIATWAAGNERNDPGRCGTGYGTTAPPAGAKNPITVGATFSDSDVITAFSSFGPTDDGRIKPTITAPGCEQGGEGFINSTLPANRYGDTGYCGTSMATPAVAGLAALMIQKYRSTYSTTGEPLPSTIKALLINTAVDKGNAGPDYQYGYGRVDGVSAVDTLAAGGFREESFSITSEYHDYSYYSSGILPIKVSLAWDDAAATPSASTQLVNDLDLTLINPSGTTYYPFVLNPASPGSTATSGADHLNNQEQVIVPSPQAGTWTIRVRANSLPVASQSYSIVFDGAHSATVTKHFPTFSLSVGKSGTGSGTISSSPAGIDCGSTCSYAFAYNTSVTLTASAATGSSFSGWSGACSGTGTCTVTMTTARSVTATFTLLTYTLSVGTSGSGTVTGTGINCPGDCSEIFNYGTSVTLTANPGSGYGFSGWSGACSGTGTCTVAMTAARSVTATFVVQAYLLTVSTAGNGSGTVTGTGISCPGDCSENYNYGTSVTLTASAATGSSFSGWSGACSGTGTCTVTMTTARSVAATFTLLTYQLTVSTAGTGSGTVTGTGINCPGDCSEIFNYGTSVTLTASPTNGSSFSSWSGACSGTGTCTVAMTAARSVTATFSPPGNQTLTVTKIGSGSGTVTSSPSGISCGSTCSHAFAYNTVVTLTATPTSPSIFSGWSGAGCSGTGTCTVTMSAARSVTATFTPPSQTLTVSKSGAGSGTVTSSPSGINCGSTCSYSFAYNTVVTLSASATFPSTFGGWSGSGCSGTGTCTVTMSAAQSVTALFMPPGNQTLTVEKVGTRTGTVTSSPAGINCGVTCSYAFAYGTSVTLTAVPLPSSSFDGWSGAGCSGTGTCTVSMLSAQSVTATFTSTSPTVYVVDVYTQDLSSGAASLGNHPSISVHGSSIYTVRTDFHPGDSIGLDMIVDNQSSAVQTAYCEWLVLDPGGNHVPGLEWTGDLDISPGSSDWYLSRSIPLDGRSGAYTFIGTLTFNGNTTSDTSVFEVLYQLFLPLLIR
jgi:subtilisin-like proprotein convertase family protein